MPTFTSCAKAAPPETLSATMAAITRLDIRSSPMLSFLVGAARFELATPSPPDWCANRAALRSDEENPLIIGPLLQLPLLVRNLKSGTEGKQSHEVAHRVPRKVPRFVRCAFI